MNEQLKRAPVGVLEATPAGTVTAINETARELLAVDADSPTELPIDALFHKSVANAVPSVFEESSPDEVTVEEYYLELKQWLSVSVSQGLHRRTTPACIDQGGERRPVANRTRRTCLQPPVGCL